MQSSENHESKNNRNWLKKNKLKKTILLYTGIFAIIVIYMIYIFKKYQKGFIWNADALRQHIVTLKSFRDILIEFIRTGNFSTFTWNIGSGINLFGNLGYYILGDFFSYLSILVPTSKIELLYNILIFVRLYCVGLTYLYFCKYKNINMLGSVIGAVMYTFCTFAMHSAVRHPYFINSMIIFPLILVGVEKIILENKKVFYTLMIALLFVMSFYFAYMISVIIAIYGIILAIYTYRQDGLKRILKKLFQILIYSLIGIMISAIVLLPTVVEFLNSERSGAEGVQPYSISYYRNLTNDILDIGSSEYWVCWGVQSIILITLPIFIRNRKKNYPIFYLMVLLLIPLLLSNIGSILCGFSYPNNRWSFVMSFLFSFITTIFINDNSKIDKKDLNAVILFIGIYLFIDYIFELNIALRIIIQLAIAIVLLLIVINKEYIESKFTKVNLYNVLLICVFSVGILFSVYSQYDIGKDNYGYVSQFVNSNEFKKQVNTSNGTISDFSKAVKYIEEKDSGFYCISKYPYSYENVSLITGFRAIGSFYSITPHYYQDICMDLQSVNYTTSGGLLEFDYRTKISTLLGVKYYIKNGKNIVPYGYTKMEDYNGESEIYVNQYSLPFAVLYDSYITVEEYDNMTPLEKESSLLKTAVVQEEDLEENNVTHNDSVMQEIKENVIQKVDYNIIDKNQLIQDNKVIVKNAEKNELQIEIGKVKNSELYLYINNIQYTPYMKEEVIKSELGDKYNKVTEKKIEEKYKWYQPNYSYTITVDFNEKSVLKSMKDYKTSAYYLENDEMLVNLGYYNETSGTITLSFSKLGTYDLSSIQILAVSMEGYGDDINQLKRSNFEVTEYRNSYLKGTTNANSDGILQFSTMYNKGWTVYVDGEKVDTFVANKYFLGIQITRGEHKIEMKYSTLYLKEGAIISIIGIMIFIGIIILNRKKKKQEDMKK